MGWCKQAWIRVQRLRSPKSESRKAHKTDNKSIPSRTQRMCKFANTLKGVKKEDSPRQSLQS
eukprot:5159309-Amphidinium_carterae.1